MNEGQTMEDSVSKNTVAIQLSIQALLHLNKTTFTRDMKE